MQFKINGTAYAVEVREHLTSNDPDDLGHCNTKARVIELLAGQTFESAMLTLSHEVCHAWLEGHITPRSSEAYCKVTERLLIDFYDEFGRQGGRAALAELLGIPFEGNVDAIDAASWADMPFHDKRLFIIRNTTCARLSQGQFEMFMARCDAAGLDPLRGDCWPATVFDPDRKTLRVEARTTIKAIRRIGQASPQFAGVTTQEFSAEGGPWLEVWNSTDPPYAARCGVRRKGEPEPIYFICRWDSYAQFTELADGTQRLADHWRRRPEVMLGKCAEAGAYARALPECDGIYLAEHVDGGRGTRHARVLGRRQESSTAVGEFKSIDIHTIGDMKPSALGGVSTLTEADGTDDNRGESGDTKWIAIIRQNAFGATSKECQALLEKIRAQSGCFEDENPEGFERLLADEARKKFGRRR